MKRLAAILTLALAGLTIAQDYGENFAHVIANDADAIIGDCKVIYHPEVDLTCFNLFGDPETAKSTIDLATMGYDDLNPLRPWEYTGTNFLVRWYAVDELADVGGFMVVIADVGDYESEVAIGFMEWESP